MENEYKYDYGATVRVSPNAPPQFRPGELASVCGMSKVREASICTIEYSDGSSLEIEEKYLESA